MLLCLFLMENLLKNDTCIYDTVMKNAVFLMIYPKGSTSFSDRGS